MTNQIGYCVKCKQKKEIQNAQEVEMKKKGGKIGKAMTGTCPVCGTKMFKILPSKPAVAEPPKTETAPAPEAPKADLGTGNPTTEGVANVETTEQEAKADEAAGDAEKTSKEMEDFDTAGE